MQYRRIIAAILVLITLIAFGRTLSCQLVGYDDDVYINPHVRQGLTAHGIGWAFTTGYAANYHPLTWLSLMADTEILGPGPRGHHLTNNILHALAVLLLYLALEKMTGDPCGSGLVAAIFAIHPLRVESVAWVSERKDVLSGCLAFATLLAYVGYARRPAVGRYLLVVGFLVLGLLAKPMLVTMPALLLLLDIWPLRRTLLPSLPAPSTQSPLFPPRSWRSLILEKLPLAGVALASCIITIVAQQRGGALRDLQAVPLTTRLSNVPIAYVRYLGKMVWFHPLIIDYPLPAQWPLWQVAGCALLLLVVSVGALAYYRRYPWLAMGWLWYMGLLIPVIGIIQVGNQSMADRYTYLPMIGLLIMLAWSLPDRWFATNPGRLTLGVATLAVLAILGAATWMQVSYWQDGISLFSHAVQIEPNDSVAVLDLGVALDHRGDLEQAFPYIEESQKNWPDARTNMNLGHVLLERGQVKQAMPYLSRVEMAPERAVNHNTLGGGYAMLGQSDKAIDQFHQAVSLDPDYALPHQNLGDALAFQQHYPEALDEFGQALALDPDNANTYFDIARTLAALGHPDQAVSFYMEAMQRSPKMAAAYAGLGNALVHQGKTDEGIKCLEQAIALDPQQPDYRKWLAAAKNGKRSETAPQSRP